jgi:hypothetical protein
MASSILRGFAHEVGRGHSLRAEHVRAACERHEDKQRAAALSVTMRVERGTRLDEALRSRLRAVPSSEAWRVADDTLELATEAASKRAPAERHRLRMRSFYVDIQDDGVTWSRPCDIMRRTAHDAVMDAVNDYSGQRDRIIGIAIDPEMTAALSAMHPAPELLPPRWPE